jgi:hypothetical protein
MPNDFGDVLFHAMISAITRSGVLATRGYPNDHLRDYVICDQLTGGFGNSLEATSNGVCSSVALFARIDRTAS